MFTAKENLITLPNACISWTRYLDMALHCYNCRGFLSNGLRILTIHYHVGQENGRESQ